MKTLQQKLEKSEQTLLSNQQKQAESDLLLAQMRRYVQQAADERKAQEVKIEGANKEKDR